MRALFSLVRLFVNERLGATLHGTAQWFSLCSKELRCVESVGGGCDLLSKLPSFTETGICLLMSRNELGLVDFFDHNSFI